MGKIIGLVFEDKFVCPVCGKEHKSQEALEKHIKDKHHSGDTEPEQ